MVRACCFQWPHLLRLVPRQKGTDGNLKEGCSQTRLLFLDATVLRSGHCFPPPGQLFWSALPGCGSVCWQVNRCGRFTKAPGGTAASLVLSRGDRVFWDCAPRGRRGLSSVREPTHTCRCFSRLCGVTSPDVPSSELVTSQPRPEDGEGDSASERRNRALRLFLQPVARAFPAFLFHAQLYPASSQPEHGWFAAFQRDAPSTRYPCLSTPPLSFSPYPEAGDLIVM